MGDFTIPKFPDWANWISLLLGLISVAHVLALITRKARGWIALQIARTSKIAAWIIGRSLVRRMFAAALHIETKTEAVDLLFLRDRCSVFQSSGLLFLTSCVLFGLMDIISLQLGDGGPLKEMFVISMISGVVALFLFNVHLTLMTNVWTRAAFYRDPPSLGYRFHKTVNMLYDVGYTAEEIEKFFIDWSGGTAEEVQKLVNQLSELHAEYERQSAYLIQ